MLFVAGGRTAAGLCPAAMPPRPPLPCWAYEAGIATTRMNKETVFVRYIFLLFEPALPVKPLAFSPNQCLSLFWEPVPHLHFWQCILILEPGQARRHHPVAMDPDTIDLKSSSGIRFQIPKLFSYRRRLTFWRFSRSAHTIRASRIPCANIFWPLGTSDGSPWERPDFRRIISSGGCAARLKEIRRAHPRLGGPSVERQGAIGRYRRHRDHRHGDSLHLDSFRLASHCAPGRNGRSRLWC